MRVARRALQMRAAAAAAAPVAGARGGTGRAAPDPPNITCSAPRKVSFITTRPSCATTTRLSSELPPSDCR